MIEIPILRELVSYNAETGELFWKTRMSDKTPAGKLAGSKRKDGYVCITIRGARLTAHRVAWAIHTGSWPKKYIDHINGDPGDNRIENLRDVSQRENIQNLYRAKSNNKLGLIGVVRDKKNFAAKIVVNGSRIHLGNFSCPNAAHAAYLSAKKKYHISQPAAILAGEAVAGARIVRHDRLTIK
jgi:HNH endonuclease